MQVRLLCSALLSPEPFPCWSLHRGLCELPATGAARPCVATPGTGTGTVLEWAKGSERKSEKSTALPGLQTGGTVLFSGIPKGKNQTLLCLWVPIQLADGALTLTSI